jgi:hypothetical protein
MASPAEHIVRLGFGFAVSQALRVVADLEIADRLVGGEQYVDDLAAQTGSHVGALYRVMRLLAAEGVFRETSDRRFGLTELGGALRSDERSGPRELIRMLNREPYLAFAQLGQSLRSGLPAFEEVFGKPVSTGWPIIPPRLRYSSVRWSPSAKAATKQSLRPMISDLFLRWSTSAAVTDSFCQLFSRAIRICPGCSSTSRQVSRQHGRARGVLCPGPNL